MRKASLAKRWAALAFLFSLLACSSRPPQRVAFFTFGDWGSGSEAQRQVAAAVKKHCGKDACDFGLLLGDNFYETGVQSVDDPQWQEKFEKIYAGLELPFYAVLGNHDHSGNPEAEIEYSELQGRWKMPARDYRLRFPQDSESPLLEIFAFDSGAGDGEMPGSASFAQLMQQLSESRARWKVLAMHHPLYSNGPHGDTEALKGLVARICPHVDAVLSGHDHVFAHLDDPKDGCAFHQWVVGTGGKALYEPASDARSLFSEAAFGFAAVEVTEERFEVSFHRADGRVADVSSLKK